MSFTVSSAYHTAIKDGISPQDFILVDTQSPMNYLSTNDGDFVAGTPTIRRSVCEAQDFTMGECPSASLTVTVANPYGDANQFWSKRGVAGLSTVVIGRAGIGVQTAKSIYETSQNLRLDLFAESGDIYVTSSGILVIKDSAGASLTGSTLDLTNVSEVSISGSTMTISSPNAVAVYINNGTLTIWHGGNTYTSSGYSNAVSLSAVYQSSTSAYVYIGMSNGTLKRMTVTSTVSSMPAVSTLSGSDLPGGVMLRKMTSGSRSIVFDAFGFPSVVRSYSNGICTEEAWEYCPVGVYIVNPPKYSLHSAIIDINDAMDLMSLMDVNLKELAEANSFSLDQSADAIVNAICTAKSIPQVSTYSLDPYTVPVTADMITADTTCRQFLKWVGERAGHLWRIDPVGRLEVYRPADFAPATDYKLTDTYLVAGYEIYNEFVDPPEKLIVYYGEDNNWTSQASIPTREDYYKISGNPLYADPNAESPVLPWLTYDSIPLKPYQLADCTTVSADPSYGYGDALIVSTTADFKTYIMQETITFGIRAMAHYVATGSETRTDVSASSTGVVIGAMSERIDEIPETIGETIVTPLINQTLEDALAEGGAIEAAISSATEGLISASDVDAQLDEIRAGMVSAATIQQWIAEAVNALSDDLHQYLSWDDVTGLSIKAVDENGQQAPTFLNLLNNRLAFMYNEAMPAWMTANTFNINNLVVQETASLAGLIVQLVTVGSTIHLRLS